MFMLINSSYEIICHSNIKNGIILIGDYVGVTVRKCHYRDSIVLLDRTPE